MPNPVAAVQPLAIYLVHYSGSFRVTDFLRVGLLECQSVVVQFAQHLWLGKQITPYD